MVKAIYSWKPMSRRPIGRPKTRWVVDVRKDIQKLKVPNWKTWSWLRRPKLYKRVVEPHKKKKAMGRPRLQYLKQVARNIGADSYTAMKRIACNKSRWKAANQSKD
jgi:hypothetical protein